jgi:hypothetical protein
MMLTPRRRQWLAVLTLCLSITAYGQQPQTPPIPPAGGAGQREPQAQNGGAQPAAAILREQRALDLLKQMSSALTNAQSMTFQSRSTVEVPAKTGQFVTLIGITDMTMQRPNKLKAQVRGEVPHFDFYYDGTKLTAFAPRNNVYSITNAPTTIDATLQLLEERMGIHFPSSDVLLGDPYAMLTRDMTNAFVVGSLMEDGSQCEHVAFTNPGINWEIWIDTNKGYLPKRLMVTYTDIVNFPRIMVEFSNWNLNPTLPPGTFEFRPPAGARQIEFQPPIARKTQ